MNTTIEGEFTPFVSILIPCFNESRFMDKCIENVIVQDYPRDRCELLILDGMSSDGTRDIVQGQMARHDFIRLVDNPARIVPTGLNIGISKARGEVIVRMDAHTEYAKDYVSRCVETLRLTGAANVGGPARTKSSGYVQQANCLAYHSPFSVGGARFHNVDYEGFVDTVTYGCWLKKSFEVYGCFDEELVRNQDDELNLRISKSGGKIWQSPQIMSWYYPRSSLVALFRQYMQYGYWKVRVIQKHRLPASIRHIVPGGFVACLMFLALLAPFASYGLISFVGLLGLYIGCNFFASSVTCCKSGKLKYWPIMPLVFSAYHFGYGYGFLRGVVDFLLLRKGGGRSFALITRGDKP